MKAVIVEDEEFASKRLSQLVTELAPDISILTVLSSVEEGKTWFSSHPFPDLIFLDIQLNDGYGFDILDDLEDHPPVIFTTAYNEFAIRGFKYNGVDYLLKPIVKTDLKVALEKFKKNVTQNGQSTSENIAQLKQLFHKEYKHRFMVKVGNQFRSFNVEDIAFFKSHEGLIFLYTHTGQSYPIEYTIDQLENILNPIHFFRVNRKFMVSVKSVAEIHSYFNSRLLLKLLPKEEEQVIVSRERTTNFKKWLDM
ncbi:LytR/AlgR family response regulator transcription factor [Flagellimonas allohymeniacidonis]|uniref:Response regulator transcription factor n=1 Tax=Flagellimonas allohymeniacidonis TaxID=2517819 RepID=A0A4V2HSI5_9FLAO|nr:LytTR family DNA-binding domain-containing protein [Allomuricauda hymeniacidonis]TAI47890.1 response regulator transcription factor [Allomuricauda hymeniacidonis]